MHDSSDGFDRVPDRYEGGGRETIDKIRDSSLFFAGGSRPLADRLFVYHCTATALVYRDRAGKKGDADEDLRKARWYEQMALHVMGDGPDPRANRPGFKPYEPQPWTPPEVA